MRKDCLATIFAITVVCSTAAAAEPKTVSDPIQISKILHAIPTFGGDLGSRLDSAGLRVTAINIDPISKDDVADDPQRWALGDIQVSIFTDGQPLTDGCDVLGSPTFIKRHGKYLPQDRTGVWLTTGKCALPN